jgi:hypothetical protein
MMLTRWLSTISFVCFGLLTLTAVYVTRRPICIDSKVVERIDRLGLDGTDTAYRCAYNKDVKFSSYFNSQARVLSQRLGAAERFLENLEPFQKKVRITILEDRPYLFKVQGNQIYIGQALLESPGHLEKALAKVWYRERTDSFFVNQSVVEEVVSDFLVYGIRGSLDIYDPLHKADTRSPMAMWPSVLKSVQGYCESPWRLSEHYALCEKPYDEKVSLRDSVVDLSLRPLLSSTWIESYRELSLMEQIHFLRSFATLLRLEHSPDLPIIKGSVTASAPSPLSEAIETVKNMNLFLSSSNLMRDSTTHRLFLNSFALNLRAKGFTDSMGEAFFDVMYITKDELTDKSPIYQQFREIALQNPKLHLALQDESNLWMLPAKYPIPLRTFAHIKAGRTIVEKCGEFDFNYVLDFAPQTEKLFVATSCSKKTMLHYQAFIKEGAEGFGAENRGIPFIQFHIPSLLMKRSQLASVPNIYDLVRKREIENPVFQSLGWQEIQWNESAKAYHPKASVDGIEWFRAPEVTEVHEN